MHAVTLVKDLISRDLTYLLLFKWSLVVLAMVVLAGVVSGQKGGAKGAMRGNRGKVRPVLITGGESG